MWTRSRSMLIMSQHQIPLACSNILARTLFFSPPLHLCSPQVVCLTQVWSVPLVPVSVVAVPTRGPVRGPAEVVTPHDWAAILTSYASWWSTPTMWEGKQPSTNTSAATQGPTSWSCQRQRPSWMSQFAQQNYYPSTTSQSARTVICMEGESWLPYTMASSWTKSQSKMSTRTVNCFLSKYRWQELPLHSSLEHTTDPK